METSPIYKLDGGNASDVAQSRSALLSNCRIGRSPILWLQQTWIRNRCAADHVDVNHCGRCTAPFGVADSDQFSARCTQRVDHRFVALPSFTNQHHLVRGSSCRRGDSQQIRLPLPGQTSLQSSKHRAGDSPLSRSASRLVFRWPMGFYHRANIFLGVPRAAGCTPGTPRGYLIRVSRGVRAPALRPISLARGTLDDSMAPAAERRATAFRLFHDLGSAKYAELLGRPADIRLVGCAWHRLCSIWIESA